MPTLNLVGAAGQPAFQGAWTNFGGGFDQCGFYTDGAVTVIQGSVTGGVAGTAIFTLPAGYGPADGLIHEFTCDNGAGTVCRVQVTAAGVVQQVGGTNGYLSLDGLRILHP